MKGDEDIGKEREVTEGDGRRREKLEGTDWSLMLGESCLDWFNTEKTYVISDDAKLKVPMPELTSNPRNISKVLISYK